MPLLEHLLHIVNLSSYLVFLCSDVSLLFFFDTTQKKNFLKKGTSYTNVIIGQVNCQGFLFIFLVKKPFYVWLMRAQFISYPKVSISKRCHYMYKSSREKRRLEKYCLTPSCKKNRAAFFFNNEQDKIGYIGTKASSTIPIF